MNLKTFCLVFILQSLRLLTAEEASEDLEDGLNPVSCGYEEFLGNWIFEMGPGGFDKTIDCLKPLGKRVQFHSRNISKIVIYSRSFSRFLDEVHLEGYQHYLLC